MMTIEVSKLRQPLFGPHLLPHGHLVPRFHRAVGVGVFAERDVDDEFGETRRLVGDRSERRFQDAVAHDARVGRLVAVKDDVKTLEVYSAGAERPHMLHPDVPRLGRFRESANGDDEVERAQAQKEADVWRRRRGHGLEVGIVRVGVEGEGGESGGRRSQDVEVGVELPGEELDNGEARERESEIDAGRGAHKVIAFGAEEGQDPRAHARGAFEDIREDGLIGLEVRVEDGKNAEGMRNVLRCEVDVVRAIVSPRHVDEAYLVQGREKGAQLAGVSINELQAASEGEDLRAEFAPA